MKENPYRKRRRLAKEAAKVAQPLGFIYFVGAEEVGRVKIGFTHYDPDGRFLALATASPVKLSKIGLMRGTITQEKGLHSRFAAHRFQLEWFHHRDEVAEFIAAEGRNWASVIREDEDARSEKHQIDHALMMREVMAAHRQCERETSVAYMMGLRSADDDRSMIPSP